MHHDKFLYTSYLRNTLIKNTIIPLVIFSIVIMMSILSSSYFLIRRNTQDSNYRALSLLNEELSFYYKKANEISEDDKVISYLDGKDNRASIYEELYRFNNERILKNVFYISDIDGNILITNEAVPTYIKKDFSQTALYWELLRRKSDVLLIKYFSENIHPQDFVYTISKKITHNGKDVGFIVFNLTKQDFQNLFQQLRSIIVITDSFDNIIYSSSAAVTPTVFKSIHKERKLYTLMQDNQPYYMCARNSEEFSFKVYTFSSMSILGDIVYTEVTIFLISMAVIFMIIIKISNMVAQQKTRSLDKLFSALEMFNSGDLGYRIQASKKDEFYPLINQYNSILDKIDELVQKNNNYALQTRIAQIKQYQAQFNPHFMFNILEVIKYEVLEDSQQAVEMLGTLAKLLRYSIQYGNSSVGVLEDDLEYLCDYLALQKARFEEKLTWELDISEKAKTCTVPKLLLQPIVENCIQYGFQDDRILHILIEAKIIGDDLVISVKDNGSGIDQEMTDKIQRQWDAPEISLNQQHIGLINTYKRIKLHFGQDCGLAITGNKNEGTAVTLRLKAVDGVKK